MIVQSFLNRLMFYHYWNDLYTENVISFRNIGYTHINKAGLKGVPSQI